VAKLDAPASAFTRQDVLKVRGRVVLKEYRGKAIIQLWPRRRGKKKTPLQQAWVDRFSLLARALKAPQAQTLEQAQYWTKGTGWYYRDILEVAAAGKLIQYENEVRVTTPTVKATRLSNISLAGGAFAFVPMTAIVWDNNSFWNASLNPSRLTMRASGLYIVGATVALATANAGNMAAEIWQNTNTLLAATRIAKAGVNTYVTVMGVGYFHANDFIEVGIFNSANTTNYQVPNLWAVAITPEALIP